MPSLIQYHFDLQPYCIQNFSLATVFAVPLQEENEADAFQSEDRVRPFDHPGNGNGGNSANAPGQIKRGCGVQ